MSLRDARSIIADIAASGMTPEQMALVMELYGSAIAVGSAQTAEKPRSKGALRQERYAERKRQKASENVSADDNLTVADEKASALTVADVSAPSPAPSLFLPPDPQPTPAPTHTPAQDTRARKGTRLAEDWEPAPLPAKHQAMVDGWPPGALERERDKFRNYWLAKSGGNATKSNWQLTWINWLLSADERFGRNGTGNLNHGGTGFARPRSRSEEMDDAMRDLGFAR